MNEFELAWIMSVHILVLFLGDLSLEDQVNCNWKDMLKLSSPVMPD